MVIAFNLTQEIFEENVKEMKTVKILCSALFHFTIELKITID